MKVILTLVYGIAVCLAALARRASDVSEDINADLSGPLYVLAAGIFVYVMAAFIEGVGE